MVLGVLYPGVRAQYFGPTSKQTVSIVRDAWRASKNYPLLSELWNVRHDTNERFVIQTQHGSTIDIDVMRGTNANSVFAEEVAQEESGERFGNTKNSEVLFSRYPTSAPCQWCHGHHVSQLPKVLCDQCRSPAE